jgi:hypothetical protein
MPKYVIERVVPGASNMTPAELKAMSQRSCNVLNEMGPQIQWVQGNGGTVGCVEGQDGAVLRGNADAFAAATN